MAMKKRGGDFAPSWTPERGDVLHGIVTELSEREGTWGPYPIATVRVLKGDDDALELTGQELALHGASRVLKDFFEEEDISEGDRIRVTCRGERTNKAGTKYYDYQTEIEKAEEVADTLRVTEPSDQAKADAAAEEPF
jgi:hypothetical protein